MQFHCIINGLYRSDPITQSPWQQTTFHQFEQPLHQQREHGGGDCTLQDQAHIVKAYTGQDRLTITAGTDECGQCRGADIDHGRGLDAGQNRTGGQR